MNRFWAGGFLYDPSLCAICLHKRDANTTSNPNKWAFFGGLNEGPETLVECFIRELREELDCRVTSADVIFLRKYFNTELNSDRAVFYVRCVKSAQRFVLGEGATFAWIDLAKVFDYDLTDKTRDDLEFFKNALQVERERHAPEGRR